MRLRQLLLALLLTLTACDEAPLPRGGRDLAGLAPDGQSSTPGSEAGIGSEARRDGAPIPRDGGATAPDHGPSQGKCPSGGSGGPKQDLTAQSFQASNGLSSKYHLLAASLDWSKPVGLAVILHGDGGGFYSNPQWGVNDMVKLLRAENLLTVNVLTPDSSTKTWWKSGDQNDEFLAELIDQEILKRYPIERDKVLLIGYSGGAEFTTIYLLPNHGEKLACGGGAILFGCGTPPWKSVSFGAPFKKSFKLHFYAGQDDEYLSNAKKGSSYYAGLGFTVTSDFPAGVNHTSIPFAQVLQGQLAGGILNH